MTTIGADFEERRAAGSEDPAGSGIFTDGPHESVQLMHMARQEALWDVECLVTKMAAAEADLAGVPADLHLATLATYRQVLRAIRALRRDPEKS